MALPISARLTSRWQVINPRGDSGLPPRRGGGCGVRPRSQRRVRGGITPHFQSRQIRRLVLERPRGLPLAGGMRIARLPRGRPARPYPCAPLPSSRRVPYPRPPPAVKAARPCNEFGPRTTAARGTLPSGSHPRMCQRTVRP